MDPRTKTLLKRNHSAQKEILKAKLSALLIMNKTNIFYLTGFEGSNGFILLTKDKSILFTDARYFEEAKSIIPKFFKLADITKWQKILKNLKIKHLGFEGDSITYLKLKKFKSESKKIKFTEQSGIIETLRSVKDDQEIKMIKKSQEINEKVFTEIKRIIENHLKKKVNKKPLREIDLIWEIKRLGHEFGAEDISFEPVVAFGKHSAIPHHKSNKTILRKGDIVLIDMGMKYKGYCSDMTRTFFTAKPTRLQKEVYSIVLQAQKNTINQIKSGISEQKIDSICRSYIKSKSYGKFFTHGTGHGVGLDIHEIPSFRNPLKKIYHEKPATLLPNMIVTVEPGIYLKGKFGIRLEDMVLVTKTGAKNLTKIKKINPLWT